MRFLNHSALILCLCASATSALATTGLTYTNSPNGNAPIAIFYPSDSPEITITRGPFTVELAQNPTPKPGNQRLMVISHGTSGSLWTFVDLAKVLVESGFIVAVPEHAGDNTRDQKWSGPESWKRRPAEISAAIDALAADARFAKQIDFQHVGVYGMSAGGLTALTLAGAQWSPTQMKRHCTDHANDDPGTCANQTINQISRAVGTAFEDATVYQHRDERVTTVVTTVPLAAPIDMASLAQPRAAIGLVSAGKDAWLAPRFHSSAVRAACSSCTVIKDMPSAGHGSTLSPWPQSLAASITPMLVDPPGFDRQTLPGLYAKIAAFFNRHLLAGTVAAP